MKRLDDEPLRHALAATALADTVLGACGVRVFPRALHSQKGAPCCFGVRVGRGRLPSRSDGLGERCVEPPLQPDQVGGHGFMGERMRFRWRDTPGLRARRLEMLGQQREQRRCPQQHSHASRHAFICTVLMPLALIGLSQLTERQARTLARRRTRLLRRSSVRAFAEAAHMKTVGGGRGKGSSEQGTIFQRTNYVRGRQK